MYVPEDYKMLLEKKSGWKSIDTVPTRKRWYDLCLFDLGDGKAVSGWWSGSMWDGLKYNGEPIKRWRYLLVHKHRHGG